jgi:hypothetical protein
MSDFLRSLRSDLLDRRFLPVLVLLGVALIAALAYAVLGGGSTGQSSVAGSTPSTSIGASAGAAGTTGAVAISQAPAAANKAVSETTSGAPRHSGTPRNPFTPLPGAKKTASSSGGSSGASSGSSSAGASSSSGSATTPSGGGTAPGAAPATPKPSAPAKPRYYIHYHVTAQFGVVPAAVEGAPPQPAQLKTYPDMALNEPLPGKENPQLVYLGVLLSTGKDAAFSLTGEAILHGSASCKPSPTQCQAIVLQAGQSETLEVLSATGQPITYELKLLSIAKSVSGSASAAKAHAASRAEAKIDRDGALEHAGLRYSPQRGGLVFIGRRAFGARTSRRR